MRHYWVSGNTKNLVNATVSISNPYQKILQLLIYFSLFHQVPADPAEHLRREELDHHLPPAHRHDVQLSQRGERQNVKHEKHLSYKRNILGPQNFSKQTS